MSPVIGSTDKDKIMNSGLWDAGRMLNLPIIFWNVKGGIKSSLDNCNLRVIRIILKHPMVRDFKKNNL